MDPNIFIPSYRLLTLDHRTQQKLEYILKNKSVVSLSIMPDIADDGLILSGVSFQSNSVLLPLAAGSDIGCGYRVLALDKYKYEMLELERKINDLSDLVKPKKNDELVLKLFSLFWNREFDELSSHFLREKIRNHDIPNFPVMTSTHLPRDAFLSAWGNIAIGNHFLEFREVSNVFDEDVARDLGIYRNQILIHLHSGAGQEIEHQFLIYFARFFQDFKKNKLYFNDNIGYEVTAAVDCELAQSFLSDCALSMSFSAFNRSLISLQLQNMLSIEVYDLFDVYHDGMILENHTVFSQKGIQKYSTVGNHSIAIIPGSLNDKSYIVKSTGKSLYINHGTGEGPNGSNPNTNGVLTNLMNPINRKYYNIQETINFCKENGLIEIIAELSPWISIKREKK